MVVPAAGVPPQLVLVTVGADVDDVLGALGVEDVPDGGGVGQVGRAGSCAQVMVVPAAGVPPQLVDMLVDAGVDDMLGVLGVEHVTGYSNESRFGRAGGSGQVVVVPAVAIPPQLVDVRVVAASVHDVLGALGAKHVA